MMARIRVLHVINQLLGAGGAERGLVREITRFGPQVEQCVVRLYDGSDLEEELADRGIPVIPLGLSATRGGWNWPLAAIKIRRLMRDYRPDVLHTSLFAGNLVGQLAAWRWDVPVVSSLVLTGDMRLHRRFQPGAASWKGSILRAVAARAARSGHVWFRAITEDVRQTNAASLGVPANRIEVIPRGVDVEAYRDLQPDRGRFKIPDCAPLFVNVGRQAAQKGQVMLVDAFAEIVAAVPEAHLAVAGREGDASGAIRDRIAERGLGERIHLLGYRQDLPLLLASADVFVFSSRAEGLGTALLEAMAAGLPVVAFDIPPVREITDDGQCARLVPVGDITGLSREAVAMLDFGVGPELGSVGRDWVRQHHSLDAIASRLEQFLRRFVDR